jgi:AraC-like DNA-binding protein
MRRLRPALHLFNPSRTTMTLSHHSTPFTPALARHLPADAGPAHMTLELGGAAGLEVRVWSEDDFMREGRALGAGIHVVLGNARASGANAVCAWHAMDAQALRASLAAGTARLLLPAPPPSPSSQTSSPPSFRGGLPPGALRRVRDFVAQRLAEKIELGQLAEIAGLSVCHFSRAFKQSMGLPPHRYLMRERVSAAALLVRTTDRPLVEISLEVGFSDQSHFTRCFSDVMRDTPRDYRRKHR